LTLKDIGLSVLVFARRFFIEATDFGHFAHWLIGKPCAATDSVLLKHGFCEPSENLPRRGLPGGRPDPAKTAGTGQNLPPRRQIVPL
jgi:hypothetical protein